MGSSLRRQLREALPDSVKGLPRAVALEIADDARWDDGWRYNPETGRRSKATLSDLVRWTAAKNERVVRDALRNLALAGWEFRVPFGKGADGRLLYAVPGRAAEFRVPDFEPEETVTTVSSSREPTEETVTTAWETATTASKPVATASEAVTTGPPSHVSSSHQDPITTTTSPAEPVETEPTDGGGGGSDLRSLAKEITAALDYRGKPPGKRLRQTIEDRLTAALAAGWSVDGLAVLLDISGQDVDYPAAVYAHRLDPDELPPSEPASAPQAFRGGVRGGVLTAAEIEALTVNALFDTGRRDTADGGMWERASARASKRTAALAGAGHQPYSNPVDQSVYDEPWTVPAPSGPPWCGDPGCNEMDRMRDGWDESGLPNVYRCPECHPDRARAA